MKERYKIMKTASVICTFWLGLALSASAQSTIAYFNGPAFQFPVESAGASIDFDKDGTGDFSFASGTLCLSSMNVYYDPMSFGVISCFTDYSVTALGANSVLCGKYFQLVIMPAGTWIGSVTSSNAVWQNSESSATLATFSFYIGDSTSGWGGPLNPLGEGYFGVRFYTQDGLHYGWVHARMSNQGTNASIFEFTPVILDWAYETRPNMPIAAGAVPIAAVAAPQIVRPGNLRLDWQSQVGKAYQVQFKEQLDVPGWINLDFTIIATAANTTVDVPIRSSTMFYRAVRTD